MIRRPPRSTPLYSSAASDVYKRQEAERALRDIIAPYGGCQPVCEMCEASSEQGALQGDSRDNTRGKCRFAAPISEALLRTRTADPLLTIGFGRYDGVTRRVPRNRACAGKRGVSVELFRLGSTRWFSAGWVRDGCGPFRSRGAGRQFAVVLSLIHI